MATTARKSETKTFHATMVVTRTEEWCVDAESAEEAAVLLAAGQGHRCHHGDAIHVEVEQLHGDVVQSRKMPRKRVSAEVVLEGETRVVLTTFDDGKIVRTLVDPNKEPTRKPRRPLQRARIKDFTRKKRF